MQKTIRCKRCRRLFSAVGERGDSTVVESFVHCPYEDCRDENMMLWPVENVFTITKVASESPEQSTDTLLGHDPTGETLEKAGRQYPSNWRSLRYTRLWAKGS